MWAGWRCSDEAGVKREPLVEARLLVDAVEELGEGGALLGAQFHLPLRVHLVDEGRRLPPEEAARRIGLAGEGRLGELLVQQLALGDADHGAGCV